MHAASREPGGTSTQNGPTNPGIGTREYEFVWPVIKAIGCSCPAAPTPIAISYQQSVTKDKSCWPWPTATTSAFIRLVETDSCAHDP